MAGQLTEQLLDAVALQRDLGTLTPEWWNDFFVGLACGQTAQVYLQGVI